MSGLLAHAASACFGAAWDLRRRAYAAGWLKPDAVGARVVSVGNLSVGGAGKTTLVLSLAAEARARGIAPAIVTRRYRPGPGGHGDEELLYRAACGEAAVHAGTRKAILARQAVQAGAEFILVDDGFSHWPLARDLDIVLLDATEDFERSALLPAGRLREPRRALQRAGVVVVSRLPQGADAQAAIARLRPWAPAAIWAAARHDVTGVRGLSGEAVAARGAAHVVTATGNPQAVAASAREAGFGPVTLAAYRDHHWFTPAEAAREHARAGGATLLLTAKDAVRWPSQAPRANVAVLEVAWQWVHGGDAVREAVFAQGVARAS